MINEHDHDIDRFENEGGRCTETEHVVTTPTTTRQPTNRQRHDAIVERLHWFKRPDDK